MRVMLAKRKVTLCHVHVKDTDLRGRETLKVRRGGKKKKWHCGNDGLDFDDGGRSFSVPKQKMNRNNKTLKTGVTLLTNLQ